MDPVLSRRSIRKYKTEPVPDGLVSYLLESAMNAPSAHNEQPWHFIVVNDRLILDQIPHFHPNSKAIKTAPIAITVCADMNLLKREGAWPHDCSAATMNILTAAAIKGLGTVWLGIYPDMDRINGLRSLLKLPDHIIPFSIIPVGYPAESKQPATRFKIERVHYNQW